MKWLCLFEPGIASRKNRQMGENRNRDTELAAGFRRVTGGLDPQRCRHVAGINRRRGAQALKVWRGVADQSTRPAKLTGYAPRYRAGSAPRTVSITPRGSAGSPPALHAT